jgi:hypothetical protein
MATLVIEIGNININNHHLISGIAGIAGYAASIEHVNETTCRIDAGDASHRSKAGISRSDLDRMIGEFVINGFQVCRI